MRDVLEVRISARAALAAVLTLALLWFVVVFPDVVVTLFLAVVLAVAMAPLASRLEARGVPRVLGLLVVYGLVLGVLAAAGALLVPVIVAEARQLQAALPGYLARLASHGIYVANPLQPGALASHAAGLAGPAATIAARLGDLLVSAAAVLVISFFMASDERFASRVIRRLVPRTHQERVATLAEQTSERLGHWVRGQVLVAATFGAGMTVGLLVMGVPFALTIGLVGAIIEIVPYVGGLVTLALATLMALTVNVWLVPAVVLWWVVVTNIEAHVLLPSVMGRLVGIQPVVVVIALFVGARLLGLAGALVAVPLAVVVQVLVDELYGNEPEPAIEVTPMTSPETRRRRASRLATAIVRGALLTRPAGPNAPLRARRASTLE
ncbi:MAG TPA: AI-2E family transporter [Thermomicrobiaceae bacterium]|nr:AI-2E family transporter [Thermomicrobiaceae bacterium]